MSIVIDYDLLNRHKVATELLIATPGCFVNWLGLKTDASMFSSADRLEGSVLPNVPDGGDGVYGGYLEYASFLTAIEHTSSKKKFTAIELGAGWGPWISAIGVVCKPVGFESVDLLGVEADSEKCNYMRQHLARNGLTGRVINGAAWSDDTILKFPVIDSKLDHGAAATSTVSQQDYRGHELQYIDVPAFSLNTICDEMSIIDYMHWDIQGAERRLALSDPDLLNRRVRYLFIGTHSRPIEGALMEFFFEQKWDLLYQHPCHFIYNKESPSIEGMTVSDGELFWRNPRFA